MEINLEFQYLISLYQWYFLRLMLLSKVSFYIWKLKQAKQASSIIALFALMVDLVGCHITTTWCVLNRNLKRVPMTRKMNNKIPSNKSNSTSRILQVKCYVLTCRLNLHSQMKHYCHYQRPWVLSHMLIIRRRFQLFDLVKQSTKLV